MAESARALTPGPPGGQAHGAGEDHTEHGGQVRHCSGTCQCVDNGYTKSDRLKGDVREKTISKGSEERDTENILCARTKFLLADCEKQGYRVNTRI